MKASTIPVTHFLLALAVVAIWGTNFVVIKSALDSFTPLWLAAMRFVLVFLPAALFLARPPVPIRSLALYGLLIGAGQFGLMFIAMNGYISPGLASLVIQTQVFFTIGLAMMLRGERPTAWNIAALAIAALGLIGIAARGSHDATLIGLALILMAALSWAGGNLVSKGLGSVNMLHFVVWSSLFSAAPLVATAWVFEGGPALQQGFQKADLITWAAVVWQAVGNTLFGYVAWGWLLSRHPAAVITPMALLVPVFGMSASAWFLNESMPAWKIVCAALVIIGLVINFVGPLLARRSA